MLSFLETKKKTKDEDPDGKWISTWNHYFHRIKHFFRWYYNCGFNLLLESNLNETKIQQQFYENENQENWKSPDFLKNVKEKRTKRLSPYVENELWQKDELLSIIKYEPFKRNKAILLFKNSIVLKFQHHSTAIERLFFLIGLEFSIGLKFYGVENFLE